MANRSITSMPALHNQQILVAEEELRSWDWEEVEADDLYADVDSLESFSISSGDEDDGKARQLEGFHFHQDAIHGEFGDSDSPVQDLGQDLEPSELHSVVGEPICRDVVPLVDPLGFLDKGVNAEEDEDGSDYESDVDDELVPRGVTDRLDKQRMRKLGKRTCARMNKSKKMPHFYTKAACLHGKHGLGFAY